ncbi:MAG TPA: Rid family detoxifying hydrolase [Chthonomonadales bacterium]|nr:Rid family detoxifying hydrolase [Chthonomonadales bacterium]
MPKAPVWTGKPVEGAPYTPGIVTNGLVFVSGQVPVDPATGKVVEGDFRDRVRRCIANVQGVLQAAGADLDNAVKVVVFLTDMGRFAELNAVYREYWGPTKPARSCVQVAGLPLGVDVEIEAIAELP